jgi:hypothetical protein
MIIFDIFIFVRNQFNLGFMNMFYNIWSLRCGKFLYLNLWMKIVCTLMRRTKINLYIMISIRFKHITLMYIDFKNVRNLSELWRIW